MKPKRSRPYRALVLYWHPVGRPIRAAIYHHLRALDHGTARHDVCYVNAYRRVPRWLRYMPVDAVILHTTLLCLRWSEFFEKIRRELLWLSDLPCPKIALPQDEYDHAELLDEWLTEIGVSDVFSVFEGPQRDLLYQRLAGRAAFHKCFTGYIDEATAHKVSKRLVPVSTRSVDIVYRATHLPYWFGSQGQLKHRIGAVASKRALERGLRTDISTRVEDTILGDRWFDFLMSGRTVLGCESGSSVVDRRGEMQVRIRRMLARDPEMSFDEVSRQMPKGWDEYSFFALSPRHFESVITKTCQVLVEGEYEGVFKRGRHYIPMRRDCSNLDEVLEQVEDRRRTQEIAETAYEEIYLSGKYGYSSLAADLEGVICREGPHGRRSNGVPMWAAHRVAATPGTDNGTDIRPAEHASAKASPYWRRAGRRVRAQLRLVSRIAARARLLMTLLAPPGPASCRILAAWCSDRQIRRTTGLGQLMFDLVTLALVREVMTGQGGYGFGIAMSYDPRQGEVRFESYRSEDDGHGRPQDDPIAVAPPGRVSSIVWDHTAMGPWVSPRPDRPGLGTWLGAEARYEFHALARLTSSHQRLVWRVLRPPKQALE
jgi:hypothetical protein